MSNIVYRSQGSCRLRTPIAARLGRVIDIAGDSVLAVFNTVAAAAHDAAQR